MNYVSGYTTRFPSGNNPGIWGTNEAYDIDRQNVAYIDESVIFGGVLVASFGHFILECLSRLWYVIENPQDKRKIVFLLHPWEHESSNQGIKNYYYDFLELLEIDINRVIFLTEVTKFAHITVPEESFFSMAAYNDKYLIPYSKIISNLPKITTHKKIYFSKTQFKKEGRGIYYGEEYFEEFYKNQGFEIIAPAKLALKEQLALVANCDEFATTDGSLCHFIVFLKKDATMHILQKGNQLNFRLRTQLKACEIKNYHLVDVSQNLLAYHPAFSPSLLGKTKYFCEYAKEQFNIDISSGFLESCLAGYIKDSLKDLLNERFYLVRGWDSINWLNVFHLALYGEELNSEIKNRLTKKLPEKLNPKVEKIKEDLIQKQISHIPILLDLHIAELGWITKLYAHGKTNTTTTNHIEALRLYTTERNQFHFTYSTESNGIWADEKKQGEISGTTGKRTPITGFALYLDSKTAEEYEIFYRIADKNAKWSNWTHDGKKVSINAPVVDIAFMVKRR